MGFIGVFGTIILILSIFGIGWFGNDIYDSYDYERKVNGLYMTERTYFDAHDTAIDFDEYGDWVCVNIRDMDPETAVKTCNHEVGHEIFAEYCEDNFDACLEVTNE